MGACAPRSAIATIVIALDRETCASSEGALCIPAGDTEAKAAYHARLFGDHHFRGEIKHLGLPEWPRSAFSRADAPLPMSRS